MNYSWLFPSRNTEVADQSDPQRRDPSHSMSLCVRMTVNARCSLHYDLPQVYPVYVNSLSSPISSLLQTQVSRSLWCCLIQATHASCRIRFFVPRLPAHPTLFLSFLILQNFIVARSILRCILAVSISCVDLHRSPRFFVLASAALTLATFHHFPASPSFVPGSGH